MGNKKKNLNNFLFLKIPISILSIIIIFEFFAFLLSDYRAIRHSLDKKVAKIEKNNEEIYRNIILFGDSVTQDISDEFDFSNNEKKVLNLTTNQASGLIGCYILYNKYRNFNNPPKYVIISSTPKFLTYFPRKMTKELYLTSVFKSDNEQKLIDNYYDKKSNTSSKSSLSKFFKESNLSIFNLDIKVVYPLINYLGFINIDNALLTGSKKTLTLNEIKKIKKENEAVYEKKMLAEDTDLIISYHMEVLVENFFKQLKKDSVNLYIAWAPLRKDYYDKLKLSKELKKLEKYLEKKAKEINLNLYIHNFSEPTPFPNKAFRDDDHLQIGYWRHYYSYLLKEFLFNME